MPDESDLRAALRAGEGEGLDADRVIGRARAVRHARRTRWATTAASVVAVAALGSGIGAFVHLDGGSGSGGRAESAADAAGANSGSRTGGGAAAPAPSAVQGPASGAATGGVDAGNGSTGAVCPARPPDVPVPGADALGRSGPLFAGRITSVTVCGYHAGRPGAPPGLVGGRLIDGGPARLLAHSLNTAPTRPVGGECHAGSPGSPGPRLVFYATTGAGTEPPVVMRWDCRLPTTNGTAVRYGWAPPADADLAATIKALVRP